MDASSRDPWQVLGLQPTTDPDAVRDAYLSQVRIHHPDQFRRDPARYAQQEEQMKAINQAHQEILSGTAQPRQDASVPPSPPRGTPQETPWPNCPVHGARSLRACSQCEKPLCQTCPGFGLGLCARHLRQFVVRPYRLRALSQWVPLLAGLGLLRSLGLSTVVMFWALLAYLTAVGFWYLWRHRWLGCLALLFVPYSLVLAGLYSLYTSLSQWRDAAADLLPPP
ncbi:MAG: J domain-containing protein [Thermaerobacter sp.]|nr:J domain-containing protein [Thermaerobacter sp.]